MSFQLPLAIRPDDSATLANFFVLPNVALVVGELQRLLNDPAHAYFFLCAPQGCGKSHLLQAVVHAAEQAGLSALYLPLDELRHYSPDEVFDSAAAFDLVVLDDVHLVLPNAKWEAALFRFYNDCVEQQRKLIIAADRPVNELECDLADLHSRLAWGGVFRLPLLDDAARMQILQHRATQLGLSMEDEVVRFILSRASRDLNELIKILDQLDHISLSQQRKLTLPFVKQVMNW